MTPWAGAYVPTRNEFRTVGSDIRRDNSFIFYGGNFDGSRKFQNDLVLSAGLAIGW